MVQQRKRHSAEFKAKVALEALKEVKTMNELSSEYGLHATQISQWKRQLQAGSRELFVGARAKQARVQEATQAKLDPGEAIRGDWAVEDGVGLVKKNGRIRLSGSANGLIPSTST